MEARDALYESTFDYLYKRYGTTVLARLKRLRAVLIKNGFAISDPYDELSDMYRWSMLAWAPGREANDATQGFVIAIEIFEQREFDGDKDADDKPIYGLNFGIEVVAYAGEIIGELKPYNYSEDCWVDAREPEAVDDRWKIIDLADDQEATDHILNYYKAKDERE